MTRAQPLGWGTTATGSPRLVVPAWVSSSSVALLAAVCCASRRAWSTATLAAWGEGGAGGLVGPLVASWGWGGRGAGGARGGGGGAGRGGGVRGGPGGGGRARRARARGWCPAARPRGRCARVA